MNRNAMDERGAITLELLAGKDACDALATFGPATLAAAAQHPLWIRAWIAEAGRDSRLILLRHCGRPVLALPVDIERRGPFRVARYLSANHANGNFPLVAQPLPFAAEQCIPLIVTALAAASEPIDVLALTRQAGELDGIANPMLGGRSVRSPDPALAALLEGGYEAYMTRHNGARKRKKRRWQLRQFEAHGPVRYFQAASPEEATRCLDQFFRMKEVRFAELGLPDPFADAGVRRFLHALHAGSLALPRPPFHLHGLEVGGVLRAVAGTSTVGARMICEFTGFARDELSHASPGDFLFHEMIRSACSAGLEIFDFSTGDEPYKRHWCTMELPRFDSYLAITDSGAALAAAYRLETAVRRRAKSTPLLMRWARHVRRYLPRRARNGGDR